MDSEPEVGKLDAQLSKKNRAGAPGDFKYLRPGNVKTHPPLPITMLRPNPSPRPQSDSIARPSPPEMSAATFANAALSASRPPAALMNVLMAVMLQSCSILGTY